MTVDSIRFTFSSRELRRTGLIGWAMCRLDGRWQLDGIAVRRRADGTYCVSFPSRRDSAGVEMPYIKPLDADTRAEIEEAILAHLWRGAFIT